MQKLKQKRNSLTVLNCRHKGDHERVAQLTAEVAAIDYQIATLQGSHVNEMLELQQNLAEDFQRSHERAAQSFKEMAVLNVPPASQVVAATEEGLAAAQAMSATRAHDLDPVVSSSVSML